MDELAEALARLRHVVRSQGARWGDPIAPDDVIATLRRHDAPVLDELVTWYSMCPEGSCLTPNVELRALDRIASGQEDMEVTARLDFPDDVEEVLSWYPLSRVENGGPVIWSQAYEGFTRPIIWRTEIYELVPETRFEGGLTRLVDLWIDAWQTGRYVVRNGRVWDAEPPTATVLF
jgi:hypothetical protein